MTEIDAAMVKRLVRTQFPQWAELAVVPVESGGRSRQDPRLRIHHFERLSWLSARAPHSETNRNPVTHVWRIAPCLQAADATRHLAFTTSPSARHAHVRQAQRDLSVDTSFVGKPDPISAGLSCSRLIGGLELARPLVPFICQFAVGRHTEDAQPGKFVLVVRPREQQGSAC